MDICMILLPTTRNGESVQQLRGDASGVFKRIIALIDIEIE
jgi:hypothetical protein